MEKAQAHEEEVADSSGVGGSALRSALLLAALLGGNFALALSLAGSVDRHGPRQRGVLADVSGAAIPNHFRAGR